MIVRLPDGAQIYGTVHFANEGGEFLTVQCDSEAGYVSELEAGCRWIDAEPANRRGRLMVSGERSQ